MALNSSSLLLISLSILVLAFAYEATAALGGWQPIDKPNDPEVVKIAQFAISEHNKEAKTALKFVTVVKGEKQVVSGLNYKLVIAAKDGGAAEKKYQAVVWDKAWQKFLKLISFEEVKA